MHPYGTACILSWTWGTGARLLNSRCYGHFLKGNTIMHAFKGLGALAVTLIMTLANVLL
eukprot:jgi/Botrbrau1/4386/Bobra.105_2s0032.1